jgi:sulfur dioxygenase
MHADHITGSGKLKEIFKDDGCTSVISRASTAKADILVDNGDKIAFGDNRSFTCIATPGHTAGCFSYVLDDESKVFTGDTLLIRGCGRTDFQGGSAATLFDTVHAKLFTLPDDCAVYPAHDYKGETSSTIKEEREHNPRLTKDKAAYIELMGNLNLSYPKKIDASLPANMECGLF